VTVPTQSNSSRPRFDWLAFWILVSCWCSLSGWILSCLDLLDRAGYIASLLVVFIAIFSLRRHLRVTKGRPVFLLRKSSYARLLPKLWLTTVLMSLAGGLLYHPDNYDYLTYRFPRVLHWAWDHHWYWIYTSNDRLNLSATGMEWLMAPLFVLFQTDRLFFLINLVSYLFLPGLVFSVFRQLGISGRVCWWWMWVLPCGLCFALQAGGMGNDLFAAIYLLASLHYVFKARAENAPRNLALSLLAIALLTGAKASNMPRGAVWLAMVAINRKALSPAVRRPGLLLGAVVVGALVSFVPVALINIHFTGAYTGDPTNKGKMEVHNPVAGLVANTVEIAVGNLAPPFWTHELDWNSFQPALRNWLHPDYPRFNINATAFQIEETAGVGPGVTILALLGLCYGLVSRLGGSGVRIRTKPGAWWIIAGATVASLAYLTKMGSEAAPRLFAAYYIVAILALLLFVPLDGTVTHRRLWKAVAYASVAMVFPLLLLSPGRLLLPAQLIESGFKIIHLPASALSQLQLSYRVRSHRVDNLGELRTQIPASEPAIGFLGGGDDPAVSPWLPFGSRKVVDVDPDMTPADLKNQHVRYVLVSDAALATRYKVKIEDLEKKWSMTLVAQSNLIFKTHRGFNVWYLLRST
jgi:hypothetical protein